jgi:HAD superfamily phosphatase (TIGR01681 family)
MSIQGSDPLAVGSSSMLAEEAAGSTASVKLVVWDLDGTLWSGTLSEEEVELDQSRIDLVRTLNRRGIVNSICSKNDEADVRARLERAGLWDEFVFASVNWSPKGPRVAQIVEDIQLRPENVLFIDDLALNREEVRASVPGIRVAGPETIDRLLSLPELQGKDDSELSRLRQYRVLEQKHSDRALSTTTNEDFLRSCDIRVGVYPAGDDDVARLFELVNRTNQLNFTKRRPDEREFAAQLKAFGIRPGPGPVRGLRDLRLLLPHPGGRCLDRLSVLMPDPQHGRRNVGVRAPGPTRPVSGGRRGRHARGSGRLDRRGHGRLRSE